MDRQLLTPNASAVSLPVVPTPLAPTLYSPALDDPDGLSSAFWGEYFPRDQNVPPGTCKESTDEFKRIITTPEENGTLRKYLEGTQTKTAIAYKLL
jgi:hypothetical protein